MHHYTIVVRRWCRLQKNTHRPTHLFLLLAGRGGASASASTSNSIYLSCIQHPRGRVEQETRYWSMDGFSTQPRKTNIINHHANNPQLVLRRAGSIPPPPHRLFRQVTTQQAYAYLHTNEHNSTVFNKQNKNNQHTYYFFLLQGALAVQGAHIATKLDFYSSQKNPK